MIKKVLGVGLVMLVVGAGSANAFDKNETMERIRQLRERNMLAAEQVLCHGAEIRNLERNKQFGVPVIIGTDLYESTYRYESYKWNKVSFVLALINYAGYERSNATIVALTARLFPLWGDSVFEAEDKSRLRDELLNKASNTVLMSRGNSAESLVNNEYTPATRWY